jgi:PKD repeat protein
MFTRAVPFSFGWLLLCSALWGIYSCDLARIESITPPVASFSIDKTSCEVPCTITITNSSTNATNYRWNFGNGQSSSEQNPGKITYTSPGIYAIQLIAIGEEGASDTFAVSINIIEKGKLPIARFSVNNNNCTAPCDPGFVNASLNGSSYRWEFGSPDSVSTEMNPRFTFKKGGDYAVKLRVSNPQGSDDTTVLVKILDRPTIKACFTYPTGTLVAPATVAFDATCSTPNAIYTWDFGDTGSINNTAAGQKVQHIFSKAGKYKVKLVVNLNGTAAEQIQELEVLEPVLADFSFTASNDGFAPTTLTFSNKSSANAISFQWSFGDPSSGNNNTSTLKNPSHTFNAPGTYIITLTANAANGLSTVKKDTLKLKFRTFNLQLGQGAGESVFQTLDGGYLVSMQSGWIKVDQTGKEQWRFTPNVTSFDTPKAVQATNGDYYFAYRHVLPAVSKPKIRIVKLNSSGTFLKQQDINSTEPADDYLGDLILNRNQELILYGVFYSANANTTTKYFARRYKLDLNLTNNPSSQNSIEDYFPISNTEMLHASNGSYIGIQSVFVLFGISNQLFSLGSSTTSFQWNHTLSDVSGLADIVQAPSGSIFVVGRKKTGTPHLSKHTLGTGDLENAKDFGYASSSFTGLIHTSSNQLVACGTGDVFLTKIDPSNFSEIWRKPSSAFSGSTASGVANTKDGGYIIVGTIKVGPNSNVQLIKTDQNGDL